MEQYFLVKEIGSGSYGDVWQAIDQKTRELVAIKKLKRKYYSLNECRSLMEVKALRNLDHPNVVKLKNLVKEYETVYFVFEYMEYNLYQLLQLLKQCGKTLSEDGVRTYCFQILQGLLHMHEKGYFHRDLKPENLLVSKDVIKIGDLGMAKEIHSKPPYTGYVTTRWYRAPEVLLRAGVYGPEVDMWAMGAIMAELMILRPIFPGISSADQIDRICNIIGSPTVESWDDGIRLAQKLKWSFPQRSGINLSLLMPSASKDAISLISRLCSWNPNKRPTAAEALQHPFFRGCYSVPQPIDHPGSFIPPVWAKSVDLEQHDSTCSCLKCELKRTTQTQINDFILPLLTRKRFVLEEQDSTCSCLKCELKRITQNQIN